MDDEYLAEIMNSRPKRSDESLMLEMIHKQSKWIGFLQEAIASDVISIELKSAFHSKWIESGNSIRKQIANDETVKLLLSKLMPQYEGGPLTLFRGENDDRFKSGALGFCWTTKLHVAEMFARGLNACNSRGVLLQAHAPINSIFTGPNEHSHYLGENEVTVDPALLENIRIMSYYPRSH